MKKFFKWTGLVILFLLATLFVATAMRQNLKYKAPYPAIKASADTTVINRGRHLVFSSAHCASCHGPANADSLLHAGVEPALTGGYMFDLEIGKIYARNITPDKETGIGKLTDAEIARTLYYGVGSDGRALFDFMPFHKVSESDMQAIISWLRSQPAVYHKVPSNQYNIMGKLVKAFLLKPTGPDGAIPKTVQPDTTIAFGSYLVNNVANCAGCHTLRNPMTGAYTGEHLAGGNEFDEQGMKFITPNLTPDSSSRIFGWNYEFFKTRFQKGKLIKETPMPWESYKRMTDDELKAIYKYLRSVQPVRNTNH